MLKKSEKQKRFGFLLFKPLRGEGGLTPINTKKKHTLFFIKGKKI